MLTEDEIKRLNATQSEVEWNDLCDYIKRVHNGYPKDWYPLVVMSGLMFAAQVRFAGNKEEIQ